MNLEIFCKEKKIIENRFRFGNIKSIYDVNNIYFTKNDMPFVPISGEFHYSRFDHKEWRKELLKMKAGGLNLIATYVFWNHHEYDQGDFNFSGNKNIKQFLSICRDIRLPCILRIGPWAHGECAYGGFPKFVQKMPIKRRDDPKYLALVENFWRKLYSEVKDYCDGITVMGIQLENEYTGNISHILTLKKLAEDIGFKTPFFSMTAWPTNSPNVNILATFGGYPEAPWTQHKKPLKPAFRFAICEGRAESEIGEDLIKQKQQKISFDGFPYAGCEVGIGNQVTAHRRPIISEKDGYGVAFAKFASGMNWIGYYMYHGGRNPNNHLLQESRVTLYPNNYPIIDYDFQTAIGKNGEKRPQYDSLRLLHTFIATWDTQIATKQAYFSDIRISTTEDGTVPYCSVRCDSQLSGYAFVSHYERGRVSQPIKDFSMTLHFNEKTLQLPSINIAPDAIFFYPFNFNLDNIVIDYILASPITKKDNRLYFVEIEGVEPNISIDKKVRKLSKNTTIKTLFGNYEIILLTKEEAKRIFCLDGELYSDKDIVYKDKDTIFAERLLPAISSGIILEETTKVVLPHNHYLYSYGKRHFYSLKVDINLLKIYDDVEVTLDFIGLNLQIFSDKTIVDDYFNTNGKCVFRLKTFANYLQKNNELIIRAVPGTKFGVGNTYNEINIPTKRVELRLQSIVPIIKEKLN